MNHVENIKIIRKAINEICKSAGVKRPSIVRGKGTSCMRLSIWGDTCGAMFTDGQKEILRALGIVIGGNYATMNSGKVARLAAKLSDGGGGNDD